MGEEGRQGGDCGIVRGEAEREGGRGGAVEVEPALGDQRDRERRSA